VRGARRGRNVQVAESTVRESKSCHRQEALAQHLIDYVPRTRTNLFRQLAANFKRFNGQEVTLKLSGSRSLPFGMTLRNASSVI